MVDEPGLAPMYIDGELLKATRESNEEVDSSEPMISGQVLPPFNPDAPDADVLYGYDGYGADVQRRSRPTRNVYYKYELFDPTKHVSGNEKSSGSHGKNKDSRNKNRKRRKDS